MKIKDLQELTIEELLRRTGELRHEIMNLRVQQSSGQLENPARLRTVRRGIAQLQTLLSQRRIAAAR